MRFRDSVKVPSISFECLNMSADLCILSATLHIQVYLYVILIGAKCFPHLPPTTLLHVFSGLDFSFPPLAVFTK